MNTIRDLHPSEARLLLALDRELPPPEAAAIQDHLTACEDCRTHWNRLARISGHLQAYHREVLQAGVPASSAQTATFAAHLERLARRVTPADRARRWWRGWWAPVRVAALAGAGLLAVWIAWLAVPVPPPVAPHRRPAVPTAPAAVPKAASVIPVRTGSPHRARRRHAPAPSLASFVALPFSDRALPLGEATVLHVQLPADELWLAGLPVDPMHASGLVEADLLLGMDGWPRAIRLLP